MNLVAVALYLLPVVTRSQFLLNSPKYNFVHDQQEVVLERLIETSPDTIAHFYPELLEIDRNHYRFDFPFEGDYRIGLIVDPCRNQSFDCCLNTYGTPTYEALISKDGAELQEAARVVKTLVLTHDNVAINYRQVYEDGSTVPLAASRTADDEPYWSTDCLGNGVPFDFCQAKNFAFRPSPLQPACTDHNFTLNTLEGCLFPNGTAASMPCVQIGYSQNAYIAQCTGDPTHCGTYIEVHQLNGSPYTRQSDKISEVLLDQPSVSGYSTTVLPLTWMGNASRVLCAYSESLFRVGSIVYVLPSAPTCCCPASYSPVTRLGAYQCPIGPYGRGAFAAAIKNVAESLIVDNVESFPLFLYCSLLIGIVFKGSIKVSLLPQRP